MKSARRSISARPRKHCRVAERRGPQIYSIAAHRGFADALVAGLVPRYSEPELGLARLTLLLPSSRARRTLSEAFIRHSGDSGLLMPRMVVVGDLDLDEALGPLLDPLGSADIAPAVDPQRRLFVLADLIALEMGQDAPKGATLLRLAREMGATMDRLLVEDIAPDQLVDEKVVGIFQSCRSIGRIHCVCSPLCRRDGWPGWANMA